MIPIRDSQWRGSVPYVTRALLILNVLVFLYTLTLDAEAPAAVPIFTNQNAEIFRESGGEIARQPVTLYPISERDEFALRFGAVPEFITGYLDGNNASHDVVESTRITREGLVRPGTEGVNLLNGFWLLLTPLTAMFLHGGWLHLIGNMLFLWVFGDNVEDRLGRWRFAIFYLLGGYLATAAHIFFDTSDLLPGIGASGAISAVLGAYLLLFPRSMVQVLIPFILLIPAVVPAPLMIGIWFLTNLINGAGSVVQETTGSGGTAWFAHLGGFLAGMALIYPFLIGRWRAPRRYTGPIWNLPPRIGWMGRRPRRRRPPTDAGVVVDLQARPPRPRGRRRGLFRRSKRRPSVDAYRDFRRD